MKIWIDLDNTPHVPFFKPIIRELEARGHVVVLTARGAFQVCELATLHGMSYVRVGRHHGKNPVMKVLGLLWRTLQLVPFLLRNRPDLALSHGSRAQLLLCNLLRIPTVMIMDYEHAQMPALLRPLWEIVPAALSTESLQCKESSRILTYEGIKEDVYAPEFTPADSLPADLLARGSQVVVTVRPPATEAHYHNPESDTLFVEFMERVCGLAEVKVILLPRSKTQEAEMRAAHPAWFTCPNLSVPRGAVDGLNLLWHSDLVVSGGGTMNREAAALGIPVYSIFRGKLGAVDRQLQREQRLVMIESPEEVRTKIALRHRTRPSDQTAAGPRAALQDIVRHIQTIIAKECPA